MDNQHITVNTYAYKGIFNMASGTKYSKVKQSVVQKLAATAAMAETYATKEKFAANVRNEKFYENYINHGKNLVDGKQTYFSNKEDCPWPPHGSWLVEKCFNHTDLNFKIPMKRYVKQI
jgi:hypothetical protein